MSEISDWDGPTADELQPKNRLERGLLYSEHLEMCFGPERCANGIALEIVDVPLSPARLKTDAAGRSTKSAIILRFRAPDGFVAPPGVDFNGRFFPWALGLNQTNKETMKQLMGTVITRWVGWVSLYVDPHVDDPRTKGKVKGIRIRNAQPKLPPSFDYLANVEKRIEMAQKMRASAKSGKSDGSGPSNDS